MNQCVFIGNLTKDPETAKTSSNISVCRFTIAVNRAYKSDNGEREADFINIVTWRGLADNCAMYLNRGSKVCVSGQLMNRTYETANGEKRYATEISADTVEFLTAKSEAKAEEKPVENKKLSELKEIHDDDFPF